jgi:phosphatidylethanolamine/phosphatidyl-N-methylethanolamine N-methyltransferase
MTLENSLKNSPAWIHFRRFLADPVGVASIIASSPSLGRLIAEQVCYAGDDYVVEIGAGTGTVTRAILSSGVPADKLIAVEIDHKMAEFLRTAYPEITVIERSAFDLKGALPPRIIGKVGSVVCGLPIRFFPVEQQRELAATMLSLIRPGGRILAYTHRLTSPIRTEETELTGRRLGFTLQNLPPASVWALEPHAEGLNAA